MIEPSHSQCQSPIPNWEGLGPGAQAPPSNWFFALALTLALTVAGLTKNLFNHIQKKILNQCLGLVNQALNFVHEHSSIPFLSSSLLHIGASHVHPEGVHPDQDMQEGGSAGSNTQCFRSVREPCGAVSRVQRENSKQISQ